MATKITKEEETRIRRKSWEDDHFFSIDTMIGNSLYEENAVRNAQYYTWEQFEQLCSPTGLVVRVDENGEEEIEFYHHDYNYEED